MLMKDEVELVIIYVMPHCHVWINYEVISQMSKMFEVLILGHIVKCYVNVEWHAWCVYGS